MFSNQTAERSLNVPVRALEAVRADRVDSRFIVGSCSLHDNHLHLLRFNAQANDWDNSTASLIHPTGPVSKICTSPTDKCVVLTLPEDSASATLYQIPKTVMDHKEEDVTGNDTDDDDDDFPTGTDNTIMETLATLTNTNTNTKLVDIQWRGAFDEEASTLGDVLTLDQSGQLTQWDVSLGAATESTRSTTGGNGNNHNNNNNNNNNGASWMLPPRMAWDPHNVDATAVSSGTQIQLYDWRVDTSVPAGTVGHSFSCHRYGVTDLDYNPNKPNVLTTAGQDGLVKFWDLRSAKQPLLTIARGGGHRHWVSKVSYNPFHDQLVLSAGTDSLVNLWRISTISSAPLLTLDNPMNSTSANNMDDGNQSETDGPNVRVSRYEHMDSVYATAWGAADAWIYVTVGYDGKVVLNHVPSKEKYKILL